MNASDPLIKGKNDASLANVYAENAVIGSLLCNPGMIDVIGTDLKPGHFSEPVNQIIFKLVNDRLTRGQIMGQEELAYLIGDQATQGIASPERLIKTLKASRNDGAISGNAKQIKDLASKRNLQASINAATAILNDPKSESSDCISLLSRQLLDVESDASNSRTYDAREGVASVLDMLSKSGALTGMSTGYNSVDRKTRGFEQSRMVIIGGRPSMGKTALGLNMAVRMARDGNPVLWVKLEARLEDITLRILSIISGIPLKTITEKAMSKEEQYRFSSACEEYSRLPIFIEVPRGAFTPGELLIKGRRLIREKGIKAIFIDYVQLMKPDSGVKEEQAANSEISKSLRHMTQELQVVTIGLAQLGRDAAKRTARLPRKEEIKWSGQYEQDADIILLIHREEEALKNEQPSEDGTEYCNDDYAEGSYSSKGGKKSKGTYAAWAQKMSEESGKAEIVIDKNRDGQNCVLNFCFSGETYRFTENTQTTR